MKVLHVITGLTTGGAELQLALLLKHLPEQCDVVCLTNPGVVADRMRADGIRVHSLGMASNRDVRAVRRLAGIISRGRYDIVHTHLYRANFYGRLAARLAGVDRIVATEHSLGATQIESRPKDRPGVRAMYRAAERLGTTTIAVSSAVEQHLREWRIDAGRIELIPNGIDVAAFRYDSALRDSARKQLGIPDDAFVIGGVGRLEVGKRFGVLIEAVAGLEDATLLLVGEGSERTKLETLAAHRFPDRSRVVFAGESDDVAPLLCAMDVFASPSSEETFGLAVLEAVAAGLPVVYTHSPALDGIETHGGTVRSVSEPEPFRRAIQALTVSAVPNRLQPPESLSRYGIEQQAARVSELYHRILRGPVPSKESHV